MFTFHHVTDYGLLLSSVPLCIVARACNVFPLAYLSNLKRTVPIPPRVQMMQFACGLRGAIAYALAANMPSGIAHVRASPPPMPPRARERPRRAAPG